MSDTPQGPGWWQASDAKWYPPEQSPGISGSPQYAEWLQRVIASVIDAGLLIPVYIAVFIVSFIFSMISDVLGILVLLLGYLAILGFGLYNQIYLQGKTGQTVGKRIIGIKVISEETGQPVGPLMQFVRGLAHTLDGIICYIGYLFPLWDVKKQTIADKVMKTIVIDGVPKQSLSADIFKV